MKKIAALTFILSSASFLLLSFRTHEHKIIAKSQDTVITQDTAAALDVSKLYDTWWNYDASRSTGHLFDKKYYFKNYGIIMSGPNRKFPYMWKDEAKGIMHIRGMWGMTTELIFKIIDDDEIMFMYGSTTYYYVRGTEK